MKQSHIMKSQTYHHLLMETPRIVDSLSTKRPQAVDDFMDWLKKSEKILEEYNCPQVAELASIRSQLLAGGYRGATRKEQQLAACELLPQAQRVLQLMHDDAVKPIEEARKIVAPLLEAVAQSGAVTFDKKVGFQSFVEQVHHLLSQHDQLKVNMVPVNATLSHSDRSWLIADMIELDNWPCIATNTE